ncbi:hypothetical protein MAR_014285 [Mya arenaria]|uniref:Uncharacterized protein n=1 Tax=Mya arenaria TaxID=6604 RepID=A0ABY7G698_MYAAR|nr:hypothetical protein MAR_014285 [Mya arenaria]
MWISCVFLSSALLAVLRPASCWSIVTSIPVDMPDPELIPIEELTIINDREKYCKQVEFASLRRKAGLMISRLCVGNNVFWLNVMNDMPPPLKGATLSMTRATDCEITYDDVTERSSTPTTVGDGAPPTIAHNGFNPPLDVNGQAPPVVNIGEPPMIPNVNKENNNGDMPPPLIGNDLGPPPPLTPDLMSVGSDPNGNDSGDMRPPQIQQRSGMSGEGPSHVTDYQGPPPLRENLVPEKDAPYPVPVMLATNTPPPPPLLDILLNKFAARMEEPSFLVPDAPDMRTPPPPKGFNQS